MIDRTTARELDRQTMAMTQMLDRSELQRQAAMMCLELAKAEANTDIRAILLVMARWWMDLAKPGPKAPDAGNRQPE